MAHAIQLFMELKKIEQAQDAVLLAEIRRIRRMFAVAQLIKKMRKA